MNCNEKSEGLCSEKPNLKKATNSDLRFSSLVEGENKVVFVSEISFLC